MINFKEWKENCYNFHADGPALKPHTLNGASNQIKVFSRSLKQTFIEDDKFSKLKSKIEKAVSLLDQAAEILTQNVDDEEKNQAHFFHNFTVKKRNYQDDSE